MTTTMAVDAALAMHSLSRAGGRQANQDCMASAAAQGVTCFVLADGLGGHGGGELAAGLACAAALESFRNDPRLAADAIRVHFDRANHAVLRGQAEDPSKGQMKSTLVMLLVGAQHALWGHVGDSRLYCFRNRRLFRQTADHSVPQAIASAGEIRPEDIRFHPDRNRLTRSLGQRERVEPAIEARVLDLSRGDTFLLCSDGFWEHVLEVEMEAELAKTETPREWLSELELRLLSRGADAGDNYSALAVSCLSPELPVAPRAEAARVKSRITRWLVRANLALVPAVAALALLMWSRLERADVPPTPPRPAALTIAPPQPQALPSAADVEPAAREAPERRGGDANGGGPPGTVDTPVPTSVDKAKKRTKTERGGDE